MNAVPGTQGYAEVLPRFLRFSESIDFYQIHKCILELLPRFPGYVLDAGTGTGRDAAAMAEMGHRVVAIEPTIVFLDAAAKLHTSRSIRWLADSLPNLQSLEAEPGEFDFVLCHAVWQHLDDSERMRALERISELLKVGGVFALALRHGPAGAGTHYFPADADETVAAAADVSLSPVLRLENQPSSSPNKTLVTWTRLAFKKIAGSPRN